MNCNLKAVLLSGLLAGLVAFVWSMISWMALPWHNATIKSFDNPPAVVQVLTQTVTKPGIYSYPAMTTHEKGLKPYVFAAITPNGFDCEKEMLPAMGLGLLINLIGFTLIAFLLSKTSGLGYWCKVVFTTLAAASGAIFVFTDSVWWKFDWAYTGLLFADHIIAAFLAGLLLAKLIQPKGSCETYV